MNEPYEIDADGWLSACTSGRTSDGLNSAALLPSPNFDERPPQDQAPSLIVIHNISLPPGVWGGTAIADFFLNQLDFDAHPFYAQIRGVRVSSHFLIRRDGGVQQFVGCNQRAWHAGASTHAGRTRCNDFSIGIELEGSDGCAFEPPQYAQLAVLVASLCRRYPIDAVAGHEDIAPGRKTDPGPHFDWQRLQLESGLTDRYFPYRHPDAT